MPKLLLHFVYGLTDPRFSGFAAVRYIGVSTNPNQRYQAHLSCPQNDPIEKNTWVQGVQLEGLEPGIEIFEVLKAAKNESKLALAREAAWIRHYTSLGADLLNIQKSQVSGHKDIIVEVPSENDPDLSSSKAQIPAPILEAGTVLSDGTIIRRIDFDDLFDLMMLGVIGERD